MHQQLETDVYEVAATPTSPVPSRAMLRSHQWLVSSPFCKQLCRGKAPRLVAMKVFEEAEEVLEYLAGSLFEATKVCSSRLTAVLASLAMKTLLTEELLGSYFLSLLPASG